MSIHFVAWNQGVLPIWPEGAFRRWLFWPKEPTKVSVRLSRSDGVMECLLDVHQR